MQNLIDQIEQVIPLQLLLPILIIQLILMIIALVSLIKEEDTRGPKWMWVLIIVFVNLFGPILYFTIGRRNN